MMLETRDIMVQHVRTDAQNALWVSEAMGMIAVITPMFDSALTLVRIHGSQEHTLWEGITGTSARLLRVSDDLALCHLPGEALFALRFAGQKVTCTQLTPEKDVQVPELIQIGRQGLLSVIRSADGFEIAPLILTETGFAITRTGQILPEIADDSRVSALCELGETELLLMADNARTGIEGWARDGQGNWAQTIHKGHWRDGLNGAVTAALDTGTQVLIGAGLGRAAEQALFDLPVMPELLLMSPGQPCRMIAGEVRVGAESLILPLTGPSAPTGSTSGRISKLIQVAGVVYIVLQKRSGSALIFALSDRFHLTLVQAVEGHVLDVSEITGAQGRLRVLLR